jgi:hypothetical protein
MIRRTQQWVFCIPPDLSFCCYWVDDRQQLSSAYTHFIAACLVFLKQNKTKQVVTFLKTKKVSSTLLTQESVFFIKKLQTKVLENCII